ncbi:MAG: hypothetical protein H6R31_83 [Methanomicrobia archaeon]|nr:hypothetical protein [Methanomicrobia archaeon]
MFITTSRDPSAKARRFAKALASFLSVDYVNRGKQRPDPEETWLVVTEDHGNPAGLVRRSEGREEKLGFRLSGDIEAPGVAGYQGRVVLVQPGRIDFLDGDKAWIRLKI